MYKLSKMDSGWILSTSGSTASVDEQDVLDVFRGRTSVSQFILSGPRHISSKRGQQLAPVASQEVWASGVTFKRSADAWSSSTSHESNIYDRLYKSERPQTFFKGMAYSVTGNNSFIGIRGDSFATHPEAELAVFASPTGEVIGYTLGNDVSARDIETTNPLYQPQSKVFNGSVALGPSLVLATEDVNPMCWKLRLTIQRKGSTLFDESFGVDQLKFPIQKLVDTHLAYRELPNGIVILTGTALAVPESAMLQDGDQVTVSCNEIGALSSIARFLAN